MENNGKSKGSLLPCQHYFYTIHFLMGYRQGRKAMSIPCPLFQTDLQDLLL